MFIVLRGEKAVDMCFDPFFALQGERGDLVLPQERSLSRTTGVNERFPYNTTTIRRSVALADGEPELSSHWRVTLSSGAMECVMLLTSCRLPIPICKREKSAIFPRGDT